MNFVIRQDNTKSYCLFKHFTLQRNVFIMAKNLNLIFRQVDDWKGERERERKRGTKREKERKREKKRERERRERERDHRFLDVLLL